MGFKPKKNRVHPSGNKKKQQRKEKKRRKLARFVQKIFPFSCCTGVTESDNAVCPETYTICDEYEAHRETATPQEIPTTNQEEAPLRKKSASSDRTSPTTIHPEKTCSDVNPFLAQQKSGKRSPTISQNTKPANNTLKAQKSADMPTNNVQPSTKVDEEGSPGKSSLAISSLSCEVVARLRVADKSVSSHEYFDAVEPIDSEAGSPKPRDHTDDNSSDEYVTASEDEEPPKEKTVCTVEKLDCAKEQADTPREEVQSEGGQPLVQEEQSRVEEEQSRVQEEQSRVQEEQSRVEEEQPHVEVEQPSNSDPQNQQEDEEEEEELLNYDDFFPPITRSKCGLRGWIFPRGVTQFHIQPERSHRFNMFTNIMSCGIIHTMWAVAFYVNSLEGGEIFRGAICPDGVEWMLRSVIKRGNTAHLENYRPQRFLTAIEAFNVVRRKCKSGMLNWDMESILAPYKALGLDLPKGDQPTGISMEFITPQSDESALAHHVAQLQVEDGDALLYCFSGNFIVFVPTGDGRILLMDEHPHTELKAGAIILVCSRTREDIQDMLNRYYKEHFNSSFNLGQGTKFSFQKY